MQMPAFFGNERRSPGVRMSVAQRFIKGGRVSRSKMNGTKPADWASPVHAMALTNEWTRVVVLTPPSSKGFGLSEGLKKLFAARDWFAVEQHDAYLAMAELCLRERAQVARSAWGLQRMELIALVVMHPEQWPQLQQLVNAVHQFVPSATIWSAAQDDSISPLNG